MFSYKWSGITTTPHNKKICGIDQANSRNQLKHALRQKNIFPLKIKLDFKSLVKPHFKIKTKHIFHLVGQLSVLLNANTPIIKALTIISQDESNPQIKNLIISCKNSISEGKSLYQTWQQYPQYFTNLMCHIVNAGEQSGTLDTMLHELTNHLKKMTTQNRKIIKALLYPGSILIVTIITTVILMIFVIPQFEIMFSTLGAKLPTYTQLIISISILLRKYWWFILILIINPIIGLRISYKYSEKFNILFDRITLNIPLVKNILTYSIISRLTKTLSLTLKAGIPLLDAINISAAIIPNQQYRLAMQKTIQLITNGKPFYRALQEQNLFPTKMIQLMALGEETGSLDLMLEKISNIYDEELNNLSDNLNNLLEPIIMLVLGAIVGGLVIGMYLPIFRLGLII